VWIKSNEFQTANFKLLNSAELKDGDKLKPQIKDLGHCEIYAQSIVFSPNGRYFTVLGDRDFVIYQFPKFANTAFGNGNEFVWSQSSQNTYASRLDNGPVKIFKNFAEHKSFKTSFANEGIFGGRLLGIKSKDFVTFYDWENFEVIRKIDVSPSPKSIYWSENGTHIILGLEDNFYLLSYNQDLVSEALQRGIDDEDGIEEAFTFIEQFPEIITSGVWIGSECFVFTNVKGQLQYIVGGKIMKLSNIDKKLFILGYDQKQSRIYLSDKSLNMTSYQLLMPLVQFQAAVLNDDLLAAEAYINDIPEGVHSKLAKFLEANGHKEKAFYVTKDNDHKFDLAISLSKIAEAFEIA
jgi:coatomer subunit beta'